MSSARSAARRKQSTAARNAKSGTTASCGRGIPLSLTPFRLQFSRSCSLACVNAHKKATECDGKRPRSSFVPAEQLKKDENTLLNGLLCVLFVPHCVTDVARCGRRLLLPGGGRAAIRHVDPRPENQRSAYAINKHALLRILSTDLARRCDLPRGLAAARASAVPRVRHARASRRPPRHGPSSVSASAVVLSASLSAHCG